MKKYPFTVSHEDLNGKRVENVFEWQQLKCSQITVLREAIKRAFN